MDRWAGTGASTWGGSIATTTGYAIPASPVSAGGSSREASHGCWATGTCASRSSTSTIATSSSFPCPSPIRPTRTTSPGSATTAPSARSTMNRTAPRSEESAQACRENLPFPQSNPNTGGEAHDDDRGPDGVRWQVGRLPALEAGKGAAASQKADVEDARPPQVPEQDHVLAERGHPTRREAELRDARFNRRQRDVGAADKQMPWLP